MRTIFTVGVVLITAALAQAQVLDDTPTRHARRITAVLGDDVLLRGQVVGQVDDFIVNDLGVVDFVIVRDGDRFSAVPWRAIRYDSRKREFVITGPVDRRRFRELEFTADRWPSLAPDSPWVDLLRRAWGADAVRITVDPDAPGRDVRAAPIEFPPRRNLPTLTGPADYTPRSPGVDATKTIENSVQTNPRIPAIPSEVGVPRSGRYLPLRPRD